MKIEGTVKVSTLLAAIDVHAIPALCDHKMDDEVDVTVEADEDEIRYELDDDIDERPLETLREGFEEVRKGDYVAAIQLFSRIFNDRELATIEAALRGPRSAGRRLAQPTPPRLANAA